MTGGRLRFAGGLLAGAAICVGAAHVAPAGGCRRGGDAEYSPEEEIERVRVRSDSAEVLRAALESSTNSEGVRLRALRALVEAGRIDQVRQALGGMSTEEAGALVGRALLNLTWLAMAGSVPEGRLRQVQIRAKDALLMLEPWMTAQQRREARAVVVRWFLVHPGERADLGAVPLGRADPAVRSAVCAGVSFERAAHWYDYPKIAAAAMVCRDEMDLARLRREALAAFVDAPFGTPQSRGEARGGVMAAIVTLGGSPDAAAEPLAAIVRSADEPVLRRMDAVLKLREIGSSLSALGLTAVMTDATTTPDLRGVLGKMLVEGGDAAAAAAAVLDPAPEVFEAVRGELQHVKIAGRIVEFVEIVAAEADRLAGLEGRCEALAAAMSEMGPNRSARAAEVLLGTGKPFMIALALDVLARVGTERSRGRIEKHAGSRDVASCWPGRTTGAMAAAALEAIAARGCGGCGSPTPGDEDDEQ